jgi:hypothetical protein
MMVIGSSGLKRCTGYIGDVNDLDNVLLRYQDVEPMEVAR